MFLKVASSTKAPTKSRGFSLHLIAPVRLINIPLEIGKSIKTYLANKMRSAYRELCDFFYTNNLRAASIFSGSNP